MTELKSDNTEPDIKKVSLTQAASKSVFWTAFGNIGVSAIRFVATAILARILMPREFGIVGMAMLYTGIVALFGNIGMGPALIQRKEIDDEYISTTYWASILVGLVLACTGILFAPFAAGFFVQPELTAVIRVLSLNFVISSFASVHTTMLTKNLRFKSIAIIEIITTFARICVILALAFLGYSYWSIVIGILFERILKTVLFRAQYKWSPNFVFNKSKFIHLFNFGKNIYAHNFLGYLNTNVDYLITGKFLGPANLALYQFSYNIPNLALTLISQSVEQVSFPLYSKIQDDKERIFRGYLKTLKLISMLTVPMLCGLAFSADNFILAVYGDQWVNSVDPLRVLCFASILNSVFSVNNSILRAIGRPEIPVKWGAIKLPITIIAIIIGSRWNIIGVAWAMLIMTFFNFILIPICLNLINGHILKYLSNLKTAFIGAFGMILVLWVVNTNLFLSLTNPFLGLLVDLIIGALSYLLILSISFKEDFNLFISFIKGLIKR